MHRPSYDDWGLPKGKALPGESDEECALREVLEETGLQCRLLSPLPSTTYRAPDGRLKVVRYWSMTVVAGGAPPGGPAPTVDGRDEVDEVRWGTFDEVRKLLTYPRDVVVLDALHTELGWH